MKTTVALISMCLVSFNSVLSSNFSRKPAEGYFLRNNISDCVQRFYRTEWDNENHDRLLSPPKAVPAVAGGIRAFNGEYPHMVAIGWTMNENVQYMCGGTLIHPKFVLTAAHCAVTVGGSLPSTVRLGDTDLSSTLNDEFANQIQIKSVKRHPSHRFARSYHDIALIELETEVTLSSTVYPACLWREEQVPNEPLRIVGFGALEEAGGNSPTLQQGQVRLMSKELCRVKIRSDRRLPDGLVDSQFCASHETMDTCQGDSGGPIELRKIDLYDQLYSVVVGVTSFGTPCSNGSTGVYTKISSYIDWIEEETNSSFSYQECVNRYAFREFGRNLLSPVHIPAYVHLLRNSSLNSQYDCAGTLIDDRFVLTSAYCVTQKNEPPRFVFFNTNGETVQIDEVTPHPSYEPGVPTNDIALLKLSMYLNHSPLLRPICLEETDTSSNPTYSFVLRSTARNPGYSYHVKGVRRPTENCDESLTENQICALNSLPMLPAICQIDNGGPILSERIPSSEIPYLDGVTGMQSTECDGKLYGTRVMQHVKWIESVIFKMQLDDVLIFT